jgi:hypothetical protein
VHTESVAENITPRAINRESRKQWPRFSVAMMTPILYGNEKI